MARPSEKLCTPMPIAISMPSASAARRACSATAAGSTPIMAAGGASTLPPDIGGSGRWRSMVRSSQARLSAPSASPPAPITANTRKRPQEPPSLAPRQGVLDHLRSGADDVPEDEQQDAGGESGEEVSDARRQVLDAAQREPKEDRRSRDRSQHRRLCSAHLTPLRST